MAVAHIINELKFLLLAKGRHGRQMQPWQKNLTWSYVERDYL